MAYLHSNGTWDLVMLEQNVFNVVTLSFDDYNVLKFHLDMLIIVQVCRTMD